MGLGFGSMDLESERGKGRAGEAGEICGRVSSEQRVKGGERKEV